MITKDFTNKRLVAFPTEDEAILFCVENFYDIAKASIKERNVFTVALSGGSTPKKLYQALLDSPLVTSIDWKKVIVFWSDERTVSPTHPDSNWAMAMQSFNKPPLSFAQKFRMEGDAKDLVQAAAQYEELIQNLCPEKKLDLVYLGIGEDGHTASLFPGTKALTEEKRLVVANFVSEKNAWRLTFTFPCINHARNIAMLAFGEKKASILKEVLHDTKGKYPSTLIGSTMHPALIICDTKAASFKLSQ